MAKYGNENAAAGGRSRDTASRDRNYGGGRGDRGGNGRGRDRSMHPGRVGPEQAARASSQAAGRQDTRPQGDHPGRVGGEQAQAASSVGAPSVDRFKDARNALGGRIRDNADVGNTDLENTANMVADVFGFHELEPEFDINNLDEDADWGFDVLGAVAGLGGAAVGAVGLGSLVSAGEELLGVRDDLSINLGTLNSPDDEDVLGGEDDLAIDVGEPSGGGDSTPGADAVMGGGGGADNRIDGGIDEIFGDLVPSLPKPPKKAKPPKKYSNVQLGDVVSVLDMLA